MQTIARLARLAPSLVVATALLSAFACENSNAITDPVFRPDTLISPETTTTWRDVSVGTDHTCGLATDGRAYCWGLGFGGQLGDGSNHFDGISAIPRPVSGGHTFSSISAGSGRTCGVTTAGLALCWGYGCCSQPSTSADALVPTLVPGARTFVSVDVAYALRAIGLATDGNTYTWDFDERGFASTPTLVPGGHAFSSISGGSVDCGLENGQAYCWGLNGGLGNGSTAGSATPVLVAGGYTFTSIAAGGATCGVTPSGKGYCWGSNEYDQLGSGGLGDGRNPVAVAGGLTLASISMGVLIGCAAATDGGAWCWGSVFYGGALGNGPSAIDDDSAVPVPVTGGHLFTSVSAGNHSCGVTRTGRIFCWGTGELGELGNGRFSHSPIPVPVTDPRPRSQ
jgi:alpha-tubulin suppressor-like RCC1 family protein